MKPNPGGHLAADEIVGRDELIQDMWDVLESRSIYMNDLRRIGKTKILYKMVEECPEGWKAIFGDLEDLKRTNELSTWFFRNALEAFTDGKKAFRKMGALLGNLEGLEIAGVLKLPGGKEVPWKESITRTFDDLEVALEDSGEKLVFCLDEVPYMLEGIIKNEGPDVAMEVLDLIRKLAQTYKNVRFILTGSIGIHHVLENLQGHGYNGTPLNNLTSRSPGPLNAEWAEYLAKELIKGRKIKVREGDLDSLAEFVASITGGVAFYIHRLLDKTSRDVIYNYDKMESLLIDELSDADEDWDLMHYINRIGKTYYAGEGEKELSLGILDLVAASEHGLEFKELLNQVKLTVGDVDDEKVRSILKLLLKDHYLVKSSTGVYTFRMALVRRWWKMERSL